MIFSLRFNLLATEQEIQSELVKVMGDEALARRHLFLSSIRHAMAMAFERFPMIARGASPIRVARLSDAENQAFDLGVPAGCEVFVGRYIRVPGLYTADGIIRYREPAIG